MPISLYRQFSSLNESNIRLSSYLISQNITTRQVFPRMYKRQIWAEISRLKPTEFISIQQQVLSMLLNDEEKFGRYFRTFYHNHLTIYEWFVLATEKHLEIKNYVFSKLLKKSLGEYKALLKENISRISNKKSMKKQSNKYSPNLFLRSSGHSKKSFLLEEKKAQTAPNSIHESSVSPHLQPELSQDYHQLFIKTLDACDGFKYIHYDFCRHQKGYENRNMYNRFIRGRDNKNSCDRLNTFYEEMEQSRQAKNKENIESKINGRVNLFSKTLSFLKPHTVHNGSKYSRYEIIPFNNNSGNSTAPHASQTENRKIHFKNKASKTLVMKKMPHQFGKQKPFSAFTIKLHKHPVIQAIRS